MQLASIYIYITISNIPAYLFLYITDKTDETHVY